MEFPNTGSPQSLSPQEQQRALQLRQVQQAAQEFPQRLAQRLDLNAHVPPAPVDPNALAQLILARGRG